MIFERLNYEQIQPLIEPMLKAHWQEVEWGQDVIPLNPNFEVYEQADKDGQVQMYGIRNPENGQLLGYATFWVYDHPHHKGTKFAINDMLYILPAYRHTGYSQGFIYFCEMDLKAQGASVITYSMKKDYRFEDLMATSGYEHTECIYSKFVGK